MDKKKPTRQTIGQLIVLLPLETSFYLYPGFPSHVSQSVFVNLIPFFVFASAVKHILIRQCLFLCASVARHAYPSATYINLNKSR